RIVFIQVARGECGDHGRVEPAGQERSAAYVGDELVADDLLDQAAHGVHRGFVIVRVLVRGQLPIGPGGGSVRTDAQDFTWLDLVHAAVRGSSWGFDERE